MLVEGLNNKEDVMVLVQKNSINLCSDYLGCQNGVHMGDVVTDPTSRSKSVY